MATVLCLQHHPCEAPGLIEDVLSEAGISLQTVPIYNGALVPSRLDGVDGLLVMGGPMSVNDQEQHPHLVDEMRLIDRSIGADRPVLGVCLGGQLIAAALEARVSPGPRKEIGWASVKLTASAIADSLWRQAPTEFMAFHWHGDQFDLPYAAVPLVGSNLTPCQAFRYGESTYALQFHLEVDAAMVAGMTHAFRSELEAEGLDGAAIVQGAGYYLPELHEIGRGVFREWAQLVLAGTAGHG